MPRLIFFSSLALCLMAIVLTQLPDPGIFGIHNESGRILFFGGSGLLAGLAGLVALVSAILWATSGSSHHKLVIAASILFCIVVVAIVLIRTEMR